MRPVRGGAPWSLLLLLVVAACVALCAAAPVQLLGSSVVEERWVAFWRQWWLLCIELVGSANAHAPAFAWAQRKDRLFVTVNIQVFSLLHMCLCVAAHNKSPGHLIMTVEQQGVTEESASVTDDGDFFFRGRGVARDDRFDCLIVVGVSCGS